jgi:hypothetical protein
VREEWVVGWLGVDLGCEGLWRRGDEWSFGAMVATGDEPIWMPGERAKMCKYLSSAGLGWI